MKGRGKSGAIAVQFSGNKKMPLRRGAKKGERYNEENSLLKGI